MLDHLASSFLDPGVGKNWYVFFDNCSIMSSTMKYMNTIDCLSMDEQMRSRA